MTLATLKFSAETASLMASFGVDAKALAGGTLSVRSPINGEKPSQPSPKYLLTTPARRSMRPTRRSSNGASCPPRSAAN